MFYVSTTSQKMEALSKALEYVKSSSWIQYLASPKLLAPYAGAVTTGATMCGHVSAGYTALTWVLWLFSSPVEQKQSTTVIFAPIIIVQDGTKFTHREPTDNELKLAAEYVKTNQGSFTKSAVMLNTTPPSVNLIDSEDGDWVVLSPK
jgi:hypothetical protein